MRPCDARRSLHTLSFNRGGFDFTHEKLYLVGCECKGSCDDAQDCACHRMLERDRPAYDANVRKSRLPNLAPSNDVLQGRSSLENSIVVECNEVRNLPSDFSHT